MVETANAVPFGNDKQKRPKWLYTNCGVVLTVAAGDGMTGVGVFYAGCAV
jgi:hypothetical protein